VNLEHIVELKPEHYFDLSTFRYKDIFDDVEVVWDVLKKLPNYLKENAHRDLSQATVHPTAIIEGEVSLGKGTIVEPYAIIKGPAIFGENCLIQPFAHIRGNVLVGDYTRIGNYTEVVNAILLGGTDSTKRNLAHFAHYNYVGYCVVGKRVVLGARVTLSSLRADWEPVTVRLGENKYSTDLKQFSAVIGDDAQIGCHTLINPGSLIAKNTWINGAPLIWNGYLAPNKFAKGKGSNYEIVDKR
jgi:NDP-sugar pyrophosphorylase family protein